MQENLKKNSLLRKGKFSYAFITNTTFVIYGLIGMVYLAVILPIKVGLFDKVPWIGCLIIGLLGVATIKLLKLPRFK